MEDDVYAEEKGGKGKKNTTRNQYPALFFIVIISALKQ